MLNKSFFSRPFGPKKNTLSPAASCLGIKELDSILCPTCGNKVTQLSSLRCPRCSASLIKADGCRGNCAKCIGHSF